MNKIELSMEEKFHSESVEIRTILQSKGMRNAMSFIGRFQAFALVPWAKIFSSGTPHQNGYLYCDSPVNRKLLEFISRSSIIMINVGHKKGSLYKENGEDIVCKISFMYSNRKVFQVTKLGFSLEEGELFSTSYSNS
ncbi:MAG: hypothetical protein WC849_02345 [Candidatus Paceibacterota bacterium]